MSQPSLTRRKTEPSITVGLLPWRSLATVNVTGWSQCRGCKKKGCVLQRSLALFETQNCLGVSSRVNQPSNAVRKEHINLARRDHRGHFTSAPNRMTHRLTGAIGARAIVRLAINCFRATFREFSSV